MLHGLTRVVAKPAVQTGLVVGGIAVVRTYQPSLVPRPRNDQALIVAASIASGYLAGNLFERVVGLAGSATRMNRAVPAVAIAAGAAAAVAVGLPAPAETLATVARTAGVVSASLALSRRLRPTGGPGAGVAAVGLGGVFVAALARQLRSYPDDGQPAIPLPEVGSSLVTGAAIGAAGWSLLVGERAAARGVATVGSNHLGGSQLLWQAAAHGAIIGAAGLAARLAGGRVLGSMDAAGDRVEPGYTTAPASGLVSGGPESTVDFAGLGLQGRRFVTDASSASVINQVMGSDDAVDAVRLYIGVDHAPTIEARVELAIEELGRSGAFDRSLLIVGSPSGTGYLNPIPIEAAEYFTHGDMATVTIQYGKRPSLVSIDRIDNGQRQQAGLVARIASELDGRSASERPRIVLYGESLGAQTSQDAFAPPGYEALAEVSVDRALWVGTPYATRFQGAVMSANAGDGRFGRAATIAERGRDTEYTFLDHHEDPVTLSNPSIFYRRPPWLGPPEDRPPHISRTQRWVPAVTFWQAAFDTKNAARVVPGAFEAFGHDYRADLAEFVRAAYAIDGVTDAQMEAVERALRRSEVERAARIAQG